MAARVPFVGLTGGIGAGKSEALRALEELGAATLSTDAIVHELLQTDELRRFVAERFGEDLVGEDGLDRSKLAERAFARPEDREWLEGQLWPRGGRRGAAPVRGGHAGGLRPHAGRDRRRARPRRAGRPPRAHGPRLTDGTSAQPGGESAPGRLRRAQRRHARGVEARAVERACDHGSRMSPAMARTRTRNSRVAVRRGRLRLLGLAALLALAAVAVIVSLGPLNKAFREITLPLRHED